MNNYTSQEFYGNIGFGLRGENSDEGSIDNLSIGQSPILYLSGVAPILTGIINPNIEKETILFLTYNGTGQLIIEPNSNSSAAQNRISYNSPIVLKSNEGCTLIYDTILNVWKVFGISKNSINESIIELDVNDEVLIEDIFIDNKKSIIEIFVDEDVEKYIKFNWNETTYFVRDVNNIEVTDTAGKVSIFETSGIYRIKNNTTALITLICRRS